MRLSIEHVTGFSYSSPVGASYNEARMTPVSDAGQTVWSSRVSIDPSPWSYTWTDYWGTGVTTFEIHEPHERMTVASHAVVDTHGDTVEWDTERRVLREDLGWSALQDTQDAMTEFLVVRERTRPSPEMIAALDIVDSSQPPRLTALDVCQLISDHLVYEPGSTAVSSNAAEVWAGSRGVCQDFSHVAVGMLRHLGIPARYVSGYLHPQGRSATNEPVIGESHSWVEWWCGQWVAFDPTSMGRITEDYVRVGHGRDYADVPPLRGTYSGGESKMFVTVKLTQLG